MTLAFAGRAPDLTPLISLRLRSLPRADSLTQVSTALPLHPSVHTTARLRRNSSNANRVFPYDLFIYAAPVLHHHISGPS